MANSRQNGFTIVEVIMFLAISGLMITGLLLAVSGGINRERYRDATNSFADFLREQYNMVDNVQNGRSSDDDFGSVGCASGDRATTNCTIIGRYITTNSDGTILTSRPVIAENDIVGVVEGIDLEDDAADIYGALGLVVPNDIEEMNREHTLRWQTRTVAPSENAANEPAKLFRLVLLRSPISSAINTYYASGITGTANVVEVIDATEDATEYVCIDPDGLSPQKTGVSINPKGVNSSAIQFATPSECRS